MQGKIKIELNTNEAIVLQEFLSRIDESENSTLFEDQAEQRVLWHIECILEKHLVAPFKKNYKELLQISRDEVRDKID